MEAVVVNQKYRTLVVSVDYEAEGGLPVNKLVHDYAPSSRRGYGRLLSSSSWLIAVFFQVGRLSKIVSLICYCDTCSRGSIVGSSRRHPHLATVFTRRYQEQCLVDNSARIP